MNDLDQQLDEARGHVQVDWDDDHVGIVLAGLHRKGHRRRMVRIAGGTTFGLLLAIIGVGITHSGRFNAPRRDELNRRFEVSDSSAGNVLQFADGSHAIPLEEDTAMVVVEASPRRIVVDLKRGAGTFDVSKRPSRVFRVRAGDVTIEVLGTSFEVRRSGSKTGIWVDEGTVRAQWSGGEQSLSAGESGWFPPEDVDEAGRVSDDASAVQPTPGAGLRSAHRQPPASGKRWRTLARRGKFKQAFEFLVRLPEDDVRDEAGDLLLAADVARLGGHPRRALPYLRRVVGKHRSDSRAPLAAFSMGRILLDELGLPRRAANAFAAVRDIAPDSPLAQDALAREVEAWAKAGQRSRARDRAVTYVEQFPGGDRRSLVEKFGELGNR